MVTTINGQHTTVVTAIPTSLNTAPSNSSSSRAGIIAGSAIAGTLLLLLGFASLLIYRWRRTRRKIELMHRGLPAPRTALLAGEDFDLTSPSQGLMGESAPQLLRPRGQATGSIFHEGVWPPPGNASRLEDPLLAGSNVDLSSIVDTVMGPHDRSSSGASMGSTTPLLGNIPRGGQQSPSLTSQSRPRSGYASGVSGASETTPLNPSGHERQLSEGSSFGSPRSDSAVLPRGAAPSASAGKPASSAAMSRSGTLPSHARTLSTLGSLVVVNSTPEVDEDNPLVDVGPSRTGPAEEIPPLYHLINDTRNNLTARTSDGQNAGASRPNEDADDMPLTPRAI